MKYQFRNAKELLNLCQKHKLPISQIAIQREMEERLGGGNVVRTEEPMYGGAGGALKIAHDMPGEFWEQLK